MTECNQIAFEFPGFRGRKIGADFGGGNVSSDGGLLLLRQVDRFSGLIKNLPDYRDPDRIIHSMEGSVLSGQASKVATLPTEESHPVSKAFEPEKGGAYSLRSAAIFVFGADDPLAGF
jgi:hypothetical protein